MSSHDFKCKYCGESTGVNLDVCQDCAEKAKNEEVIVNTDNVDNDGIAWQGNGKRGSVNVNTIKEQYHEQ